MYLCFQRVAAEILGVKLNKAEIEQSQVSHNGIKVLSSHHQNIYAAAFLASVMCSAMSELKGGHRECVRSM